MIIAARGHTLADTGAHVDCLSMSEVYYNELFVQGIEAEWADFPQGAVIRSEKPHWAHPDVKRSDNGVYDLMDQADALGCDIRVECHHNHFHTFFNCATALFWATNQTARSLAIALRKDLHPMLEVLGVRRFHVYGLPSPAWGRRAAIYDSRHTTLIFEPAFMHPAHAEYFQPNNLQRVARATARTMRRFWEARYG